MDRFLIAESVFNFSALKAPYWLTRESVQYLTVVGSHAYGTSTPESDFDFYGFCMPPLEYVFPHTAGYIEGFSENIPHFENFEVQHVSCKEIEFDATIYSIVKYFSLCMKGNPNMVDSLFTPNNCIVALSNIGTMVRKNANLFLSQRCWHSFKGMAYSHISRLRSGHTKEGRLYLAEKYGYDTKDAYHSIRMLLEIEMILREGTLDLEYHKDTLKGIREGAWSLIDVLEIADRKIIALDEFLSRNECAVPYSPDEKAIRSLLVKCLEEYYGNLDKIGFPLPLTK